MASTATTAASPTATTTTTTTARALEEFGNGNVDAAQSMLDEAAKSQQGVHDLLSIHCLRATLAAMKGSMDVSAISAQLAPGEPVRVPVQSYLEGIAAMARGDLTTARRRLETAVERCEGFGAAMVCLASVYYLTGAYEKSYAQYCDTLKMIGSEKTPPVVRVGMGLCAFRLQRLVDARRILERATEVHPDDELAWLGVLAVYIDLRMLPQVHTAVMRLKDLMPQNTTVLLKVCDLAYFRSLEVGRLRGSMERLRSLLHYVRQTATPEEAALVDFHEGRLLLACGDVAAAQPLLESVVRTNPKLLAARIHYARLLMYSNQHADAERLLREVNEAWPNEKEVLQMLAILATRAGRHSEALRYSHTLTMTVAQGDVNSWALAAVCSRLDAEHCRRICAHVRAVQRELQIPSSVKLSANLAILSEDVEALQGIVDAELGAGFLLTNAAVDIMYVPLLYNLALLREGCDPARARQLYVYLVKHHSTFAAPYYRLHFMAKAAGQLQQAVAWLQWLLKVHPAEAAAQTCLAQLYMERSSVKEALAIFTKVKASESQLPVALAVGATSLQACQQSSSQWPKLLDSARSFFRAALAKDPRNILAAHGYACCDGLERRSDAAESMLNSVSEVTPLSTVPTSHVDAHRANVKMLSGGYKQAADYFSRMPTRTSEQEAMYSYCMASEGRYAEALDLMRAASAKASGEDAMLVYNTALLHFMAFVDGLKGIRAVTAAEGDVLLSHLEAGLQGAALLDTMKGKHEVMSRAKRYLRSISAYCERHRVTVHTLVEAGQQRAGELAQSEHGWRRVYASHQAEQQRRLEEEELAEHQKVEERKQAEADLYARFCSSSIQRPTVLFDQNLMKANIADAVKGGIEFEGELPVE
ncbi:RNA polymerase-associated protein CTR9 [Novymonas esmeraldas]|uniref:RNA polymerase-associated protein CTR9 n=1 Tax=Novymonas esmeraldas TaxID=1808958 RepID=A0AAW0F131_9TRYP